MPEFPSLYDNAEEDAMIQDFQKLPTPEKFEGLYNTFSGALEKSITSRMGMSNIPRPAIKGQAIVAFDKALKAYQPGRAKFTTWLDNQMRPINRYVRDHADIAHIPDNRNSHIMRFRDTVTALNDQLGREPTTFEIADSMQMNEKEIGRLQKEMKKDLLAEEGLESFIPTKDVDIIEDRARAMMMDLAPFDQLVLEHQLGLNGKPKLVPNQIAKQLKTDISKVRGSAVKIQKRWKEYYGGMPL